MPIDFLVYFLSGCHRILTIAEECNSNSAILIAFIQVFKQI